MGDDKRPLPAPTASSERSSVSSPSITCFMFHAPSVHGLQLHSDSRQQQPLVVTFSSEVPRTSSSTLPRALWHGHLELLHQLFLVVLRQHLPILPVPHLRVLQLLHRTTSASEKPARISYATAAPTLPIPKELIVHCGCALPAPDSPARCFGSTLSTVSFMVLTSSDTTSISRESRPYVHRTPRVSSPSLPLASFPPSSQRLSSRHSPTWLPSSVPARPHRWHGLSVAPTQLQVNKRTPRARHRQIIENTPWFTLVGF